MRVPATEFYAFGSFKIDPTERLLLRDGQPVTLTQKVFDLLLLLVQNNGHVVEKEKLMKEIWPDSFVEEGNLTQNISVLRKVLSDEGHQYIQTVHRRGYRFVGNVSQTDEHELVVEEHSLSRLIVAEHQPDSQMIDYPAAVSVSTPDQYATTRRWRLGRTWTWSLIAAAVVAIAVAYSFLFNRSKEIGASIAPANGARSIAVLPFQNLGAGPDEEFLGLGMTDALISRLSNIKQADVRPTSAVRKYANPQPDAATAGRELRVDSVLAGTVQKDGDRIRVSVQLVEVKTSKATWARTFDEKMTNIFAVEDAISEQIAQAMTPKLTEDERMRLTRHYTNDPKAHELYLQGRLYLNKFTEDGSKLARKYFEQAIDRDAGYALAYSGLAESYAFGEIGLPPAEAFPKARDAATKALALDDSVGEAHAVLAQVGFLWDWNWEAAETQFKRAIELAPADPEIHHMYAHYLTAMGRFDEALAESRRLLDLDPLSPASRNHLGWHYLYQHQFDQAIEQYKLVLAIDPNFPEAHRQLGEALWEKSRFDESVAEMNRQFELVGRGTDATALKQAYAAGGWNGYWRKRLELVRERSKHTFVSPSGIAYVYAGLKDKANALTWLETAYREHDHGLVYLKVDHMWDLLRTEPRFQELLVRMRLG